MSSNTLHFARNTLHLDWALHANRILRLEEEHTNLEVEHGNRILRLEQEHLAVVDRLDKGLNMIGGLKQLFDQAEANNAARFAAIDARLDQAEANNTARFDAVDTRLDGMDARFDAMDTRFDTMESTLQEILSHVSN